jgi:3-dehydroquinate dehydratase / shikimate dehydrogenase
MAKGASLPKICIALGFPSVDELLRHARAEVDSGESFLEFRLDYLPQPVDGVRAIRQFTEQFPDCAVLATCRRHQNHGRYNGSISEQLRILDAAIEAGARAVDVEIESAEDAVARLPLLRSKAQLVISFHNYSGTPAVEPILRRMMKIPADCYKLVTTAKKPSDNFRVLSLSRTNAKVPMVMLAMGEAGLPTRVLATAYGASFSYASPNLAAGTAAGQLNAKQLRNLYRIEKFTKNAKVYGVIADPIRHSISPAVHNRAFQSRRMDAVYVPFLVHPAQLKDFFLLAGKLPVTGMSVTLPHKQKIIRYLDVLDPLARRIGAVNTVVRKAGKWRGSNTDVDGVLVPLAKMVKIPKATVLVVGNGGAARGAAFALTDAGAKVTVVGRNPDRVRALAKASGATALMRDQLNGAHFDAVIHATPLGMWPHVDECFFKDKIPGDVVFEMVYNPIETELVKRARADKKEVVDGLQMFIEQAVKQFELFTGESAPRPAMERAAQEALENHHLAHTTAAATAKNGH